VASRAAGHSSPPIAIVSVYVRISAPGSILAAFAGPATHPPPLIELTLPSLPLLI
jgi:hypothetical protein